MSKVKYIIILAGFIFLNNPGIHAQSWPAGIHDPSSIVKCDNTYWIFATGDGIHAKYSTDMVAWSDGPTPFTTSGFPAWILNYAKTDTEQFEGFFWAPDIIFMNDQYYLYYSCSIWGTMNSCIGVVVNKTLNPNDPDYEWVDQGDMGIYSSGGYVNAIDPAIMRGHDGRIWLTYGSFNRDGIMITEIDSVSGKPVNSTRTSIANSYTSGWYGEGEGASLVYKDGYYYLFYNKGGCCNGIASTYYIVMGRATDPQGPYYDKSGKAMRVLNAPSGGTVVLKHDDKRGVNDRYYGPGHFGLYRLNGVEYVTFHYYDPNGYYPSAEANYKGGPTLGLAKLEWGDDGWPYISLDFLDEGIYKFQNANSGKVLDLEGHSTGEGKVPFQYFFNPDYDTQKWLFTPLGAGEYSIRNYDNIDMYLEAAGNDYNEYLRITSNYSGAANQKFRAVQSPNGQILIYPTTKDNVMEIPNAYLVDYQVKLWPHTNHNCQRWYAAPFVETFSVNSATNIVFEYDASSMDTIDITSNGSWSVTVEDDTWLSASPGDGSGNATLHLEVSLNDLTEVRSTTLTIQSNAGSTSQVYIHQKANPTGINENRVKEPEIFPNPADGLVHLRMDQPCELSIYDIMGRQIITYPIQDLSTTIDISDLKPGVYLFKITGKSGSVTRKVLKN